MDVAGREAFTRGFLTRCAEEGLTKEAVSARIDDAARFKQAAGEPGLLANTAGAAVGLPILAGLLAGGTLGYGAAKVTEPDTDVDQVRADEIANTYRVYAQRAAAKKKLKAYRPAY